MSDLLQSPAPFDSCNSGNSASSFIPFPREAIERSIPERFEYQASLHPDQIAVADASASLTYRGLNRLANRIAHAILALHGPEPEPVALLVGNGVPVIAAMLGVLKAGKFYIALDTSQPMARSATILNECQPTLLIVNSDRMKDGEALQASSDPASLPLLNIDTLDPGLSEENPAIAMSGDNLAYILYTSGSTGKPKGVIQDHRYVLHLAMVYTNGGEISNADRLVLLYSSSFAGAVRDIYCTLLNGATLFHFDVKRNGLTSLAEWLRQQKITVFFAVATMFRHFCRLLTPEDKFPDVRLIFVGSETVFAGEVRLYQRHFPPNCRMIASYGSSELSPICQMYMDGETRIERSTVPSGHAVDDVELQIWDTEREPVLGDATGEIVVRSRYLSRGYWKRPDLTEAAFGPDPEGGDRRIFRTGDQGRLLPDGCLLHLGRSDFQVKIRGYRVETAEIEAFFTSTGQVRDALVTAWLDSLGEQNLAAWLVPMNADAPPSIKDLRTLAAAALPDYMVPVTFVLLDSLPLTANGKLDRRALPDPRQARLQSENAEVAPRTAVEHRLKELWSEILGVQRIGLDDNFFDLGGHSLLAMQIVARIAASFRVSLSPNCLFEHPRLADLAQAVESARSIEPDEMIHAASESLDAPLSFAQARMWILDGMEGPNEAFTSVRAFRLEGALDATAFKRAVAALAARHDNLRVSFRVSEDQVVQTLAADGANAVSWVDLRHLPEGRRDTARDACLTTANSQCFDLAHAPLWSIHVIRLAGNDQVLHIAMHHIIVDDWSFQVFLKELAAVYSAYRTGQDNPLLELPIQYADYARWQRRWLAGARATKQLDYWLDHLRGAPQLLRLPLDRPRQGGGTFHASLVKVRLDSKLTARLRLLSRESETTLFVTLLTAYAILLSQYGNPEDLVIGTALANRYPVETEALIGFFVNTLALRVKWRQGETFREIQAHAHRTAINGYANPDVPFDRIVDALQPSRSASHSPVLQTMFVLQSVPRLQFALPGLSIAAMDLDRPSAGATLDLTLSLRETDGELHGAFEYNPKLFDSATIEHMAARFESLLVDVVQNPDSVAGQLDHLGVSR